jgi:hypothetical protein
MATVSFTIQIDQKDAPFLQALITEAQTAGKTLAQMFDESKASGQPLTLKVNGEQMVMLDETSYAKLVGDARQREKDRLRQLLADGINSGEPEELTEETWNEMEAEVVRRANERKGAATK